MTSSLKTLCGIPALVVIANHPDIKEQIFSSSYIINLTVIKYPDPLLSVEYSSKYNEWSEALQNEVSSMFEDYSIPEETIPWHLLPFIGVEMLKWTKYLEIHFNLPIKFIKNFIKSSFFTSRGLLDEEKAARELLEEPSLTVFLQYKIACHYFFQDVAQRLWKQFHEEEKYIQNIIFTHDFGIPEVLWKKYFEETEDSPISKFQLKRISSNFISKVFCYGMSNGNLTAIKLISKVGSKDNTLEEIEEKVKSKVFKSAMDWVSNFFEINRSPLGQLLSRTFSVHRDIVMHLISLAKTENKSSYLSRFGLAYVLLRRFLIWPYQDLFMKTAISVFHILNENHFYILMHLIVDTSNDQYLSQTYNYKHLLREFWIKSPSEHKKYFINVESGQENIKPEFKIPYVFLYSRHSLLKKITMNNNCSQDDEINFKLILESATLKEKENFLRTKGHKCISELLFKNKFKLADMYLNTLTTNDTTRKEIKKKQAALFFRHVVTEKWCFHTADKFVNWVVSPDEVCNLKKEIFPESFKFSNVADAFLLSKSSTLCLTKFLEWFGKTDAEIKEWKTNGVFDYETFPICFFGNCSRFCIKQLDNFFEWLGYAENKILKIKDDILRYSDSKYLLSFFLNEGYANNFHKKLLYLCSNNKERVKEYVKMKQRHLEYLLIDQTKTRVYFINKESRFELWSEPDFKRIDSSAKEKFYYNFKRLHFLISEQDNEGI